MALLSDFAPLQVQPVSCAPVLKESVHGALKRAIMDMDIYGSSEPLKLDERRLAENLGVSRTPVREALLRLEQEGLVSMVPRRGAFVVKKTKAEILDVIYVWAGIEGMAARLATIRAADDEIASLRDLVESVSDSSQVRGSIDEYSEANIRFHQAIVSLSKCSLLSETAEGLFVHMRAIRARTIKDRGRARSSMSDHTRIIEAIESRNAGKAEQLVRDHALRLAEHVEANVDYLE
jgi:DNA-binding GntR family transcriptional regulator